MAHASVLELVEPLNGFYGNIHSCTVALIAYYTSQAFSSISSESEGPFRARHEQIEFRQPAHVIDTLPSCFLPTASVVDKVVLSIFGYDEA
jgi:hypothetical protein